MSKVTVLATAQLSATDTLTIELIEADETPAVVIFDGPKPSVLNPRLFPAAADVAARTFAAAVVKLAAIKRERRL